MHHKFQWRVQKFRICVIYQYLPNTRKMKKSWLERCWGRHRSWSLNFSKAHISIQTYISDLPGANCPPVQYGDRLGVFIEAVPSSVAHIFKENNPMALTHPLKRDEGFAKINDTITFDALAFPYEYNAAAYVDTSMFCSVPRCALLPPGYLVRRDGTAFTGACQSTEGYRSL